MRDTTSVTCDALVVLRVSVSDTSVCARDDVALHAVAAMLRSRSASSSTAEKPA